MTESKNANLCDDIPVSEKMTTLKASDHVELRSPKPSITRSNRDLVMIALGVLVTIFLLVAGYLALFPSGKQASIKPKGPVKDPRVLTQPQTPGGWRGTLGTQ